MSALGNETLWSFSVPALEDLPGAARQMLALLKPGSIIGLSGELGAGKTTLVRALMRELGCLDPVSSPTFVLAHEYRTASGEIAEHWDLYRLSGAPEELLHQDRDLLYIFIEWPERVDPDELNLDYRIRIDFQENGRLITLERTNSRA